MSKIVVLNSGGFDSVVLAHHVDFNNQDSEIHNLFFNYGQLNVESERKHSIKCAEKLGFIFREMTLPKFDWSNSVLSGGSDESQYIPMRNLIFLSYALSYAESIGASEVYCAFIDPECEYYNDTSPLFLEKVNELSNTFGISVKAPFIHSYKGSLLKSLARKYAIYREDVHSCNYGEEPCGKCSDCEALDEIFDSMADSVPDDILIDNNFNITEDFIESVKQCKVTTAKLYINNTCQFSCSHCFIGKHKLFEAPLSIEEWCNVLEQLAEYGITHIDFFGKEPLFNDKVFTLLEKCKSLGLTYSLITNGVNVMKYIDLLEYYKPTMALSVESLYNTKHRDTGKFILQTIKLLLSRNIKVSVSIDLTKYNFKHIIPMIKTLYGIGVEDFYIKPVRPFGNSEQYLKDEIISSENLFKFIAKLRKFNSELDINITLSLAMMDLERLYNHSEEEFNKHFGLFFEYRYDYIDGIILDLELYCYRFKNVISITPEGFLLGCASEYCTDYSHYKNVKENTVEECINSGKESLNFNSYSCVGCYFCEEYKKEGKIFQ